MKHASRQWISMGWVLFLFLYGCGGKIEKSTMSTPVLTKLWETDSVFESPESVIYDSFRDVLYVSNVGSWPGHIDDDGFISKLSTNGEVLEYEWVTGLSSALGMGIVDSFLYVTNVKEVAKIDIPSEEIIERFTVDSVGFLNDITTSPDGIVYITDSRDNRIYQIMNDEMSLFYDNPDFGSSNGILYTNGKLVVAGFKSGNLTQLDLANMSTTILADSLFEGDGINTYGDDFFVSRWSGMIEYVKPNDTHEIILDLRDSKNKTADTWYEPSLNTLYIATFLGNSVVAYQVSTAD